MTQSSFPKLSKDDIINKWAPIIESVGITGSKANWMAEYAEMHSINEQNNITSQNTVLGTQSETTDYNLLPVAMKVASKTVGLDLVSVTPIPGMGNSQEEMDRINAEIKAENREGKIESVLENKEYKEKTVKDHPDYKGPIGDLMYLDFKYDHKKTRRAGKKHKKKNGK